MPASQHPHPNTTMPTTSSAVDSTTPSTDDSTTYSADDSTTSSADDQTISPFIHIVIHVFLPVELPDKTDNTPENSHSLARAVWSAAHAYGSHVSGTAEQAQWNHITKMLDVLQASVQSEYMANDHIISQLREMQTGGTFEGSPQIPGADNL